MSQRRSAPRRARLAGLTYPALLLLLAPVASCGGQRADPASLLGSQFPAHAGSVLGSGRGFVPGRAGFAAVGDHRDPLLGVELPADGAGAIVLHGPRGFEARVREIGAAGAGRVVDRAVVYPRDGGASFWTTAPGGIEEWLHVDAAHAQGARPAAVWRVTGARVRSRGDSVELVGPDGAARVRVTAPAAFAASGRRVEARLSTGGPDRDGAESIELHADGGGEAVLVDPVWKVVAPMAGPRLDPQAALVKSGKVLAAGGTDGVVTSLDSASLYDRAADAWTEVGPMVTPHVCHTETALDDGTVLVVGGLDDNAFPQYASEVFVEGQPFAAVGDMSYARMNHAAARLTDGRVLVTGGISGGGVAEAQASSSPPSWILPFGSTCWGYGGGGCGGPGATDAAEIYDPAQKGWLSAAFMLQARSRHTETLLPDGRVLATGGMNYGSPTSGFEIYDPVEDYWYGPEASMSDARADHTATLLPSGDVLLVGGTGYESVLDSAEIIPASGNSSGKPTAPMSTPRTHHTAALLSNGTVLVVGGTDGQTTLASAEIFDPMTETWSPAPLLVHARSEHAAAALPNDEMLVVGGADQSGDALSDAELYVTLLDNGAACIKGAQCKSTFCTEGVCCNAACSGGVCQACTVSAGASADGTCTPIDGVVCDEGPCKVSGLCLGGACTAAVPKACVPPDDCHVPGTCDPGTGVCSKVAKLDGSPCSDGICVAGTCVPDPHLGAGGASSTSSGTTTTSSGTTTTGTTTSGTTTTGAGGAPGPTAASLSGNGCSAGGAPPETAPAGLLLGLLAALRRRLPSRRRPRRPGRSTA